MKIQYDKVWFTSDLHFWHKNICTYCNRPFETMEEMHEALINNWNSVVKEDDTVFLLGDMGFCGYEKLKALLSRLKGQIILITGNHDDASVVNHLLNDGILFDMSNLCSITVTGDDECPDQQLMLCHFPMIDWLNKEKGSWMIHGHQHQLPETPSCSTAHWDVGVDKNHLTPVSFEQLKINITKQFVNRNNENM